MSSGFVAANYLRKQQNIIPQTIFIFITPFSPWAAAQISCYPASRLQNTYIYRKIPFPKLFFSIFTNFLLFFNFTGYMSSGFVTTCVCRKILFPMLCLFILLHFPLEQLHKFHIIRFRDCRIPMGIGHSPNYVHLFLFIFSFCNFTNYMSSGFVIAN